MSDFVKELEIYALATDPIYIGTGGYTIGRVDNTIVRDPITGVPKIPGSSLAGTWRYYVTLKICSRLKNKFRKNKQARKEELESFLKEENKENYKGLDNDEKIAFMKKIFGDDSEDWILFEGNRFVGIKCAGQDDLPTKTLEEMEDVKEEKDSGHCGHCIVCKGFGFSKKDISWQGQIFFSDLNILFFPVFTMKGTRWITTVKRLKDAGFSSDIGELSDNKIKAKNINGNYLNLGWLYLEVEEPGDSLSINPNLKFGNFELKEEDIVIVPETLFSHIVNSNLEVRTSVSIDPITGAAKEGALFTSEAIPRGTIFYGEIRIFDKRAFEYIEGKLRPLPGSEQLISALNDSKQFYETLGIGGMTTRGFGRLKIELK